MKITERRIRRHGPVMVKLEDGSWIEEQAVSEASEPVSEFVCGCGFQARNLAGLISHQRVHADEEE